MFSDNPLPLARMMKLIQYIRGKELLPIASGNRGYWLTNDPNDIQSTLDEFQSRIESFQSTMEGLRNMKSNMKDKISPLVESLSGVIELPKSKNDYKFNHKQRNEDRKDDIFDNLEEWNLNLYK